MGAIADVEIADALDGKFARARPADQEALDVALGIEAAFRDRDQRAGERQPARHEREAFEPPVVRQLRDAGRHRDRLAARQQAVTPDIETHDAVHALDAEIDRAAILGDRLGVVPAARRERLAVGAEHRRHLGVRDPGRPRAVIDDAPAQPAALVGDGEEARAVGGDAQRRDAAEFRIGRGQLHPAAECQRTEAHARRIARLEDRDRLRVDDDSDRCFRLARTVLGRGRKRKEGEQRDPERCAAIEAH